DYQGAAIRSVRPVERTGAGGLRSRWVDRFGNAGIEGKRRLWPGRAGALRSERLRGQGFSRLSLPVLLRSACDAGNVSRRGTARRRNRVRVRHFGHRWLRAATTTADSSGSGGLSDGAKLLGQLRQDRRSEWCWLAGLAALRSEQGFDLRFPPRWLGQRGSGSLESAA